MIGETRTLHPAFRMAIDRILHDMRERGWDPVIGSGMRTNEQQDALFAQGRRPLKEVNELRKQAGLPPISAQANKGTVTPLKGGQSNHNLTHVLLPHGDVALDVASGYAVDIVDRKRGWEIPDKKFWTDLGLLAKKYGCRWGGDFKRRDVAHVEMKLIEGAPITSVVV